MKLDILIKNGRVVDPSRGMDSVSNVGIIGNRVVEADNEDVRASFVFDAEGLLVLPGLIDFHAHVLYSCCDFALHPDLFTLPMGVTTVVDAGTAGTANVDAFRTIYANSQVRIKYQMNFSPTGLTTRFHEESIDPKHWDRKRIEHLCRDLRGELVGLKIRQSRDIAGELGCFPLQEAVKFSDEIRAKTPGDECLERATRLVVHTTNPPEHISKIADLLRKGDVFSHLYQGTGMSILENNSVHPAIREAKARGVVFDAANGKGHFAFGVAERALAEGFAPDVISTDLTEISHVSHAVGLPHLMSRYLYLGMSLSEVVKAVTSTPAGLLGMSGKIGTLAPGAYADVSVFSLRDREVVFTDALEERRVGKRILMPELTISSGKIACRQMDRHIEYNP